MGDRTYVTLTVRRADKQRVLKICEDAGYGPNEEEQTPEDPEFVEMGFEEVDYGELPFLGELEQAGIPFDSSWASGDEYGEGTKFCRYDDNGEHVPVELYESDYNIPIDDLMQHLADYNELATFIRKKKAGIYVIPWETQEHNAKLFRTKQLIAA